MRLYLMNFMLHHCPPVYMCVCLYNLLSCIFDSYSSNLGKMQIQMVSIGATFSHCQVQQERELEGRTVILLYVILFVGVFNFLLSEELPLSISPGSHFMNISVSCIALVGSHFESSPFNRGASS